MIPPLTSLQTPAMIVAVFVEPYCHFFYKQFCSHIIANHCLHFMHTLDIMVVVVIKNPHEQCKTHSEQNKTQKNE